MASVHKTAGKFARTFEQKLGQKLSLTAGELFQLWLKCDKDGNGFIEGIELDYFLREFVSSVCSTTVSYEVVSETMLAELKEDLLDAYDDNGDGKIELRELAHLLPTDENFLLLFQMENRIHSSIEFMQIWKTYDKDNSGFIEANELRSFLQDLLDNKPVTEEKMDEYVAAIIQIFDENKDGKLQLSEMARLLPVKENVLSATLSKGFFTDKNGKLEGNEISGFVKDMVELMKPTYNTKDLQDFEKFLMKSCDLDGDGTICKEELTIMLLGIQKFQKK